MPREDKVFGEISIGQTLRRDYVISPPVYDSFLASFDDRNPLHTDDAFAREQGFLGRVMHGTILNGFISHLVGMCLPSPKVILHSVAIDFKHPCYLGDRVRLEATISQKVEALHVIVLTILIQNLTQSTLAAKAKVQAGFLA